MPAYFDSFSSAKYLIAGFGTNITVTVNGVASNAINFTVAPAKIYFVSVSDGSNNYDGLYATYQGGNHGPFKDIKMFNPAYNPSGWNESYIVYVRGGTYINQDIEGTFVALKAPVDSPDLPRALIGYPSEMPVLDMNSLERSAIWSGAYSPYKLSYSLYTIAKLKFINGKMAIGLTGGHDNRIVGNIFANNNKEIWSGIVMVREANHQYIYGNYFYKNGYDSYKHEIYVKTHKTPPGVSEYVYIGWNEFDSWTAALNPSDPISRGGAIFISTASDAYDKGITNNVYIFNNYFHDGDSEAIYIGDGGGSPVYIYNNIFANIIPDVHRGIYLGGVHGTQTYYLYNNVFFKLGSDISPIILISKTSKHAIFKNNIFYAKNNQPYVKVEHYNGAYFHSENDLFYGSSLPSNDSYISITNQITADPLFVNPSQSDFHLQKNSPAIDAGISLPKVTTDFDGNPRPMDGDGDGVAKPDIGAFEYCPEGATCVDTTPPSPPQNLRIIK